MKNLIANVWECNSKDDNTLRELKEISQGLKLIEASYMMPMAQIKSQIMSMFQSKGYILKPSLSEDSQISIDGIKRSIAIQAQTGNASRYYADIMKFQYLYNENRINSAIYICFTNNFMKKHYSGNVITAERASKELKIFDSIINVPIGLIAIEIE